MPNSDKAVKPAARLHQRFDAEALGSSLKELAVNVVEGEGTDFVSRWFKSAVEDVDLVIWIDSKKRIIKHQLCFFGQIVEWTPIHGTRTGFVIEEEIDSDVAGEHGIAPIPPSPTGFQAADGAVHGAISETIRFDTKAQKAVVRQAIDLIKQVPDLTERERFELTMHLQESTKLHPNARQRALKAWAAKADEIDSTRRPTFWHRFRNWVLGD